MKSAQDPRSPNVAPGDAVDPRRLAQIRVRRNVRGPVPDAGLSLRHDGDRRGALQRRGAGLHLFALRQPDGVDVRAADGAPRGRRGGAGDGERHGGGHRVAHGATESRRPYRRLAGSVRLVSLRGRGSAAAFRRRLHPRRRRRISTPGARRSSPNTKTAFLESPTNPTLDARGHRRRRRDHAWRGRDACR